VAEIQFCGTGCKYRVEFSRDTENHPDWEAYTEYVMRFGNSAYREPLCVCGRTQMAAAKALARELGLILFRCDLDEEQAALDRETLRGDCGAPTAAEQDRECAAEHEARLLDRD